MSDMANLTGAILAGGLGTRLRPVIGDSAKVLAAVQGRPFVLTLLDQLDSAGVRRVVMCTGYQADDVARTIGDSYKSIQVTYSREPTTLGTAGALRFALPLLQSDPVMVLNGDSHTEVDLSAMLARHRASGAAITVALATCLDAHRFGRVHLDQHDRITRFEEKAPHAGAGWINAGVYLFQREMLETIPTDRAVSLEREVFPAWVDRGLFGFRTTGQVIDIGTPSSFAAAQRQSALKPCATA
jgi:NDP-sugar pyrophosphorylase family protein